MRCRCPEGMSASNTTWRSSTGFDFLLVFGNHRLQAAISGPGEFVVLLQEDPVGEFASDGVVVVGLLSGEVGQEIEYLGECRTNLVAHGPVVLCPVLRHALAQEFEMAAPETERGDPAYRFTCQETAARCEKSPESLRVPLDRLLEQQHAEGRAAHGLIRVFGERVEATACGPIQAWIAGFEYRTEGIKLLDGTGGRKVQDVLQVGVDAEQQGIALDPCGDHPEVIPSFEVLGEPDPAPEVSVADIHFVRGEVVDEVTHGHPSLVHPPDAQEAIAPVIEQAPAPGAMKSSARPPTSRTSHGGRNTVSFSNLTSMRGWL